MQQDSPRWHEVTPSSFPAEKRALRGLRELLLKRDPLQAWSNFTFIAPETNRVREVDLLVLAPDQMFLIEIKSLHGRLTGDAGEWVQHRGHGRKRSSDNPLILADQKSKELRTLLNRTASRQRHRVKVPYVQPIIYLSEPDLVCDLAENDRPWVYGPPGPRSVANTLPSIADLFSNACEAARPGEQDHGDLANLLGAAGVKPSRRRLALGKWQLDPDPYEVGPTWQDHHARHETTSAYRRVRIYLYEHEADEDVRRSIYAAAMREFKATEGVEHVGILRAEQLEEHQDGPALVIRQSEDAQRLDHYLTEYGPMLDQDARLDLVSQLADAVLYAHSQRLAHRALSPRAVIVTQPDTNVPRPRLQVGEWQFARSTAKGSEVRPTTNAARHIERSAEAYLAPEYQHAEGTFAADIFGVGAITYLLITGEPPACNREALLERLGRDGGLLLPQIIGLPGSLADVVARATAPAVADRVPDIDEFRRCLSRMRRLPEPAGAARSGTDVWTAGENSRLPDGDTAIRVLGAGSTARVLLMARGREQVLVKVARSAAAEEYLEDEARILGSLRHPGIVLLRRGPYHLDGRIAIEVDIAGKVTLRTRLNSAGCSPDELKRLGSDLLDILAYLESTGTRHRDIKPDNLALRPGPDGTNRIVLFDFSHAGVSPSEISAGTAGYLDPFLGIGSRREYDAAADRYAVAVTLHEMASGKMPIWGTDGTAARYVSKPTLAAEHFPEAHRDQLVAFFEHALAKEVTRRFASADEMHQQWENVFQSTVRSEDRRKVQTPRLGLDRKSHVGAQSIAHPRTGGPAGRTLAAQGDAWSRYVKPTKSNGQVQFGRNASQSSRQAALGSGFLRLRRIRARLTWPPHLNRWSLLLAGISSLTAAAVLYTTVFKPNVDPIASIKDPDKNGTVAAIAFNPKNRTLATADGDGSTYTWNLASRKPVGRVADPGGNRSVEAVTFSPDGKTLATGDDLGGIYLWDATTHRLIAALRDPGGRDVNTLAFSPDGKTLAVGDFNGYLYCWNVATRKLARVLDIFADDHDPVSAVAFSPDGKVLAVATGDLESDMEESAYVDRYSNTEFLHIPSYQAFANVMDLGNPEGVSAVAFSRDGKILATGDGNGTTYLWELPAYRLVGRLTDPNSAGVGAVAFSADGKVLATGDVNNSTYIWRIPANQLAATLTSPSADGITGVGFSPGDRILATASAAGITSLWSSRQFNP